MTVTRIQAVTILLARCEPMMEMAGMSIVSAADNVDLNDPLQWAILELGGTVSDISSVTDADLATVASDDERYIPDVAELRLLDNILSNLTLVDLSEGPHSEKFGQLPARIEQRRDKLAKQLEAVIGLGAASLTTGLIVRDFAEHVDT